MSQETVQIGEAMQYQHIPKQMAQYNDKYVGQYPHPHQIEDGFHAPESSATMLSANESGDALTAHGEITDTEPAKETFELPPKEEDIGPVPPHYTTNELIHKPTVPHTDIFSSAEDNALPEFVESVDAMIVYNNQSYSIIDYNNSEYALGHIKHDYVEIGDPLLAPMNGTYQAVPPPPKGEYIFPEEVSMPVDPESQMVTFSGTAGDTMIAYDEPSYSIMHYNNSEYGMGYIKHDIYEIGDAVLAPINQTEQALPPPPDGQHLLIEPTFYAANAMPVDPVPETHTFSGTTGDPMIAYNASVGPMIAYNASVDHMIAYNASVDPMIVYNASVDPMILYNASVDPMIVYNESGYYMIAYNVPNHSIIHYNNSDYGMSYTKHHYVEIGDPLLAPMNGTYQSVPPPLEEGEYLFHEGVSMPVDHVPQMDTFSGIAGDTMIAYNKPSYSIIHYNSSDYGMGYINHDIYEIGDAVLAPVNETEQTLPPPPDGQYLLSEPPFYAANAMPVDHVPQTDTFSGTAGDPMIAYNASVDPMIAYNASIDPMIAYNASVDPMIAYNASGDPMIVYNESGYYMIEYYVPNHSIIDYNNSDYGMGYVKHDYVEIGDPLLAPMNGTYHSVPLPPEEEYLFIGPSSYEANNSMHIDPVPQTDTFSGTADDTMIAYNASHDPMIVYNQSGYMGHNNHDYVELGDLVHTPANETNQTLAPAPEGQHLYIDPPYYTLNLSMPVDPVPHTDSFSGPDLVMEGDRWAPCGGDAFIRDDFKIREWPDCVGLSVYDCESLITTSLIEANEPMVQFEHVRDGSFFMTNYDVCRVRIFYEDPDAGNDPWVVSPPPERG